MPSFHLKNGVGPVVKCKSDPCKLHGGSDFTALNQEQAEQIGQTIMAAMYKNVDTMGLRMKGTEADDNRMKGTITAAAFIDATDSSLLGQKLNALALSAAQDNNADATAKIKNEKNQYLGSYLTVADAIEANMSSAAEEMSDEEAQALISDSKTSYSQLYARASSNHDGETITDQHLAEAAMQISMGERSDRALTDSDAITPEEQRKIRRAAGQVLTGKTNLDEQYINTQKARLAKVNEEIALASDGGSAHLAQLQSEKAVIEKSIAKGKMPAAVRRRIIQNAWHQASPKMRARMISEGKTDVLRYAPATQVANSLRHRSQEQRFKTLLALHDADKTAFKQAVLAGSLRPTEAKSFANKIPVEKVERVTDKKTGKTKLAKTYSDTDRFVSNYIQMTQVAQGNSGGRYKSKNPNAYSGVEREQVKAQNAKNYRAYLARQSRKYGSAKNFTDEHGNYDYKKQAQALYSLAYGTGVKSKSGKRDTGYLPAATAVIASHKVPDKAMSEFFRMAEDREEARLAHSKYQSQYAAGHKDSAGNAKLMHRWHNMQSLVHSMYPKTRDDVAAMRAMHE